MDKKNIEIDKYNKKHFSNEEMNFVLEERGLKINMPDLFESINYAYIIYEFSDLFYYSK